MLSVASAGTLAVTHAYNSKDHQLFEAPDLQASDAVLRSACAIMPGLVLIPKLVLLSWHIIIIVVIKHPLFRVVAPAGKGRVADPLARGGWLQIQLKLDALLRPKRCTPCCTGTFTSAQSGMQGSTLSAVARWSTNLPPEGSVKSATASMPASAHTSCANLQ